MPSLAETQTRLRDAIIRDDGSGVAPLLVGGHNPAARLAIHRRHYARSLTDALMRRFPALVWLLGSTFVETAAREFVLRHPPSGPCIAEYGNNFPLFLESGPAAERVPWLRWFGGLEWHLAEVALAIERPAIGMDAFAAVGGDAIADVTLRLQPGLRHLEAPWPIDEVMTLYLTQTAPERYTLEPADVRLEIRGARGEFRIDRVDPGTFAFRVALAEGQSIGAAAERALDGDPAFDPGRALTPLVGAGLVTAINEPDEGAAP